MAYRPGNSDLEALETDPLVTKRVKRYRAYDEALMRPYNAFFAENLELALRSAVFMLIFATPFIFESHWDTPAGAFKELGVFAVGAGVFILFVFSRTVGETVRLAWGTFVGISLSVGFTWLCSGLYPGGYTKDQPEHAFYWLLCLGGAFMVAVLILNVQLNTKIFAVLSFSFHWMALLTGEVDSNYGKNFELDIGKYGMCELLACLIACFLAILASLVPEPLWAMDKARERSLDLTEALGEVWSDILCFFCAVEPNPKEQEKFMKDMAILHHEVAKLEQHIENSWWECFGMGRWQEERIMLARFNKAILQNYDRLTSVWNAVVQEEFGKLHEPVMRRMNSHVKSVAQEAHALLTLCGSEVCNHGQVRVEKIYDVERALATSERSMTALMQEFRMVKASMRLTPVTEELLDEHTFCISVSGCGRTAAEFAEDLLKHGSRKKHLPSPDESQSVFDTSVLSQPGHLSQALRRTVSVFAALALGYRGYGQLILPGSSSIAATVAIMFSNHLGSPTAENIDKLQGCILGTVIGQITYSMLGWCSIYYMFALASALFLFTFVNMFLFYKSAHHGNIALYIVAFGSNDFLLGCSRNFAESGAYNAIMIACVAMAIVIVVDLVFASRRASDMAKEALVDVWRLLSTGTLELFDVSSTGMRAHKGAIMRCVQRAELLGVEAVNEPRYWRTPWRDELFTQAIQCFYRLRMSLSALETELSTSSAEGGSKDDTFMELLKLDTFKTIQTALTNKMRQIEILFGVFVHETRSDLPLLSQDSSLQDDNLFGEMDAMQNLIRDVNSRGIGSNTSAEWMSDDPASEISLVIATMSAMTGELRLLQKALLRAASKKR